MHDVRVIIRDLALKAKEIHRIERTITLQSVDVVGELDRYNAAVNLCMRPKEFAKKIGLSLNQLWKRTQAARVFRRFPEARAMVERGETTVSSVALLSPKITEANSALLLSEIKGLSKRKVKALLSRVTKDGRLLEREAEIELRLIFKESELEVLERAREILSAGGKVPTDGELIVRALRELVKRRDPLEKAKRSVERQAKRKAKSASPAKGPRGKATAKTVVTTVEAGGQATPAREMPSPAKGTEGEILAEQMAAVGSAEVGASEVWETASPAKRRRAYIPAAERHRIWLESGGACTYRYPDGTVCGEKMMVEMEHVVMVCRGGGNDKLTLHCRRHNRAKAERELGTDFVLGKIAEARSGESSNPG